MSAHDLVFIAWKGLVGGPCFHKPMGQTFRLSHRPSKTVYYIVDRRISELHHGSSEFLELDIFPAYSMQFDSTYPNLA